MSFENRLQKIMSNLAYVHKGQSLVLQHISGDCKVPQKCAQMFYSVPTYA